MTTGRSAFLQQWGDLVSIVIVFRLDKMTISLPTDSGGGSGGITLDPSLMSLVFDKLIMGLPVCLWRRQQGGTLAPSSLSSDLMRWQQFCLPVAAAALVGPPCLHCHHHLIQQDNDKPACLWRQWQQQGHIGSIVISAKTRTILLIGILG